MYSKKNLNQVGVLVPAYLYMAFTPSRQHKVLAFFNETSLKHIIKDPIYNKRIYNLYQGQHISFRQYIIIRAQELSCI